MIVKSSVQETELNLLSNLLKRDQNRVAGAKTFSMDEMKEIAEDTLRAKK